MSSKKLNGDEYMTQFLMMVIGILVTVVLIPGLIVMYEVINAFPTDTKEVIDPHPDDKRTVGYYQ